MIDYLVDHLETRHFALVGFVVVAAYALATGAGIAGAAVIGLVGGLVFAPVLAVVLYAVAAVAEVLLG
jgi:hypothetical protein